MGRLIQRSGNTVNRLLYHAAISFQQSKSIAQALKSDTKFNYRDQIIKHCNADTLINVSEYVATMDLYA